MESLFSLPAGKRLLVSLRRLFEEKPIYLRRDRFILFVCGGTHDTSLRRQFIEWAKTNLPEFICLVAEDAFQDSFAGEGRAFVNLGKFESVIASIADSVVIFPESPGSFAETGFFAGSSKICKKTLVANHTNEQEDSFLNLGPIHTINQRSYLQPTVYMSDQATTDFAAVGDRLKQRVKWPYREELGYRKFNELNFKHKLVVVFEMLMLLRLADWKTLSHTLSVCFQSTPQNQELTHLLRILMAANFVRRNNDTRYFRTVPGLRLVDIENVDIDKIHAEVALFYQENSTSLFDALSEVAE